MIDLASLPPPSIIVEPDFEVILAECKDDFIGRYPAAAAVIDLESEPIIKLLEEIAYRELLLRARYNDEARALLLCFAVGADLDHIGATYYDETRLLITPADLLATPPVEAVWEGDEDYRQRLALKPESYSVAGPRDAFRYHAISASGLVKDVSVSSPQGGTTQIYVLSRVGGGVPDATLLATVSGAVNGEDMRPLSEEVLVSAPTLIDYVLSIELTLFAGPSVEIVLQAVNAALAAYAAAHHRLAADIVKSAIDAAAHVAGVKKVTILSPAADIDCGPGEAPWCTAINVTVAGVEAS